MTSTELYAKAAALDTLAADVEVCVDPAKAVASSPDWCCANADDVREAITHWRAKAWSAATHLRAEASRVRSEARLAADREEDAREEARREREPQAW